MQQRAGLLFISKKSQRILLILEDSKWTVPTFNRKDTLLEDANPLLESYQSGRIVPVELYLSADRGFEYGTYVCIVNEEFIPELVDTFAWCNLLNLPKQLHSGLKTTLNNSVIKTKIETIMVIENAKKN